MGREVERNRGRGNLIAAWCASRTTLNELDWEKGKKVEIAVGSCMRL